MLSFACQKLKTLADIRIDVSESDVHTLDLTANLLKDGTELKKFNNLTTLILDNNQYFFIDEFPSLPML